MNLNRISLALVVVGKANKRRDGCQDVPRLVRGVTSYIQSNESRPREKNHPSASETPNREREGGRQCSVCLCVCVSERASLRVIVEFCASFDLPAVDSIATLCQQHRCPRKWRSLNPPPRRMTIVRMIVSAILKLYLRLCLLERQREGEIWGKIYRMLEQIEFFWGTWYAYNEYANFFCGFCSRVFAILRYRERSCVAGGACVQ